MGGIEVRCGIHQCPPDECFSQHYPQAHNAESVAYTGRSLRTVTLCEESGFKASAQGICILHNGDACLYEYRHPYDNATDRWKKAAQWGEHSDGPES